MSANRSTSRRLKRLLDVTAAGLGLLLLGPIIVVVALLVRLCMGSPVLFRHVRPGHKGRPFELLKFRTMREAPAAPLDPAADAARITRLGKFLRRASLDELPQLWNVLRGDMSLVGPRPLLPEYLPLYSVQQARRHEVKPGITGWAQVNGRNALSWDEKFRLDVWYVENQNLWLDLKILLLTVRKVLVKEGIDQGERVTMEPFQGTREQGVFSGDDADYVTAQ